MRRHPKASSVGSKLRKPSGHGSSPPSGRLRLTILLATVAAFLLVPAAQAFATDHLTVNIAGNKGAGGEVSSVGGMDLSAEGGTAHEFEGEPPIACSYASPGPKTGTCEDTMANKGGPYEEFFVGPPYNLKGVSLHATPAPGFAFAGWTVEEGDIYGPFAQPCSPGLGANPTCFMYGASGGDAEVTATFTKVQPLTLKKTGTGEGTAVSSPAGIECGPACPEETHSFEEGSLVTLTANPAEGSVFTSWIGCTKTVAGTGPSGHKCTVEMSKALTVTAKLTKVKVISGAKDPEGNGFGTVTSSPGGISCGPACAEAKAVFTEGSTVTVKAAPVASTSVFAGWTSCPGTEEGANCKVVASEAKTATAKFNLIQQFVLTYATGTQFGSKGTGTVSSSPAGISCGPTCTIAKASYNSGKEVTLKEVPATGSEFNEWGGYNNCSGSKASTCTVTMSEAKGVVAYFK